jgi:hypothetical protein
VVTEFSRAELATGELDRGGGGTNLGRMR